MAIYKLTANSSSCFTLKSSVSCPILRLEYMAILFIFFASLFYFPSLTISQHVPMMRYFTQVPSGGPESLAFDPTGAGPYTGVNDGRILKFQGQHGDYTTFAYTSPHRSEKLCDGKNEPALGPTCGRALGLGFNNVTKELYIADAYYGLCVVGPAGGRVTQLLSGVDGKTFKWLDGLDVDQTTGNVYITEMSNEYYLSQREEYLTTDDRTGRLIEYNPHSKQARVLLNNLLGAGGVGVSKNGTYLLVSEHTASRITKYWLKGPKADTAELFLTDIPSPGNIKTDNHGSFWISCNLESFDGVVVRKGVTIDESGKQVGESVWAPPYSGMNVSEFQESPDGYLYLGSLEENFFVALP